MGAIYSSQSYHQNPCVNDFIKPYHEGARNIALSCVGPRNERVKRFILGICLITPIVCRIVQLYYHFNKEKLTPRILPPTPSQVPRPVTLPPPAPAPRIKSVQQQWLPAKVEPTLPRKTAIEIAKHQREKEMEFVDFTQEKPVTQIPEVQTVDFVAPPPRPMPALKPPVEVLPKNHPAPIDMTPIHFPAKLPNTCKDIRGTAWLTNFNITDHFKSIAKDYPHLQLQDTPSAYKEDQIRMKVLKDCGFTFPFKAQPKEVIAYFVHVSGNHWALLVIDHQKKTVEYYDPKSTYGNHNLIQKEMKALAQQLSQKDPAHPYQFQAKIKQSLQPDGYQCGVWVGYFLDKRMENPDVDFNLLDINKAQSMIAHYRLMIQKVLYEKDPAIKQAKLMPAPVDASKIVIPPQLPKGCKDLSNNKWLSNMTVGLYFKHLSEAVPFKLPYVWGYNPKFLHDKMIELFATEKMTERYLPFQLIIDNNHSALVLIDRKRRTLEYYDSKVNYGDFADIQNKLKDVAAEISKTDPGVPYTFQPKIKKNLQPDAYQCGVWTCYFLQQRLHNPDVDFNQLDVDIAQKSIADYRLIMQDHFVKTTGRKVH